jgi:hypothetical protein
MMTFLIVFCVLAALFVLLMFVNPVLMVILGGTASRVTSNVEVGSNELVVTLTLCDSESPRYIVSLDMPRTSAEEIGIGAPTDFRVEPLRDSRSDPDWLEEWNRENIRFTGDVQLAPNTPTVFRFSLMRAPSNRFQIKGQLESGRTFFNSVTIFFIKVPAT